MAIISIIIPVHNAATFIERCAHSLFAQTMEDLEYIFVDDGSSDNSIALIHNVLEEYPLRKTQVHIVQNLQNLGISETRKVGLSHTTGEYVGWVDADDWVELDMMDQLYCASENGEKDIVVCDYWKEYKTGSVPFRHDSLYSPEDCLEHLNLLEKMPHSLWSQIIKRNLFDNGIVRNLRPADWGEDLFFVISAYCRAHSITLVRDCLYHYNRTNVEGLSRKKRFSKEVWLMQRENIEMISQLMKQSLGAKREIGINHLKFVTKNRFFHCFDTPKEYFQQWSDCHRFILRFDDMPLFTRLKLWFIHSSFGAYSLYHKMTHA